MPSRTTTLARLASEIAPRMIELRRDVHRHPEMGWAELRTTRTIAETLRGWGLEPQVRPAGTGLTVEVGQGDKVVGFRADLDALPILEEASPEYQSTIPGIMHACGHDAHLAIATGIAWSLAQLDDLPGRVRLIYQPAEESVPGGATMMRAEGVLHGLSAITAFHVDPALTAGSIGLREGGITGASDRLIVRLSGPGGHTSRPHQTVNLLYAAARVVTDLPEIVRHRIDARQTVLVVFGRIAGGSAENVIPTHVELGGTVRMLDLELWRTMPKLIEGIITDLVAPLGATCEIDYLPGSPPVVNDPTVVRIMGDAARDCVGGDRVVVTHQSLGSEDFAWYLEDVPGAMLRLGGALAGRHVDLHSAGFDIDESAIEAGILVGAESLLRLLEQHP
jgi:amidohydrolase